MMKIDYFANAYMHSNASTHARLRAMLPANRLLTEDQKLILNQYYSSIDTRYPAVEYKAALAA